MSESVRAALRDEFLLFFTGRARRDRPPDSPRRWEQAEEALHRLKELAGETCAALEAGDLDRVAELMQSTGRPSATAPPGR